MNDTEQVNRFHPGFRTWNVQVDNARGGLPILYHGEWPVAQFLRTMSCEAERCAILLNAVDGLTNYAAERMVKPISSAIDNTLHTLD